MARACLANYAALPACVNQHVCIVRVDAEEITPAYLLLYLLNKKDMLLQMASTGGTRNALTKGMLESLLISYPDIPRQNKVVSSLSPIIDKVSKNNEAIKKYTQLISTLYLNWFNDFNYPTATGELIFSSQLERKIPSDWDVVPFQRFLTPISEKIGDATVPIYSTTNSGIALRDEKFNKNLTKSQANNKKVVKDDLVFGLSREILNFGVFTDEIGSVSPAYQIFKIDQSVILPFMLELELRINMSQYMDILQLGAREGQGIRKDYLMNKCFLVPKMEVQEDFFKLYNAIQRKIVKLKEENAVLAEIRDTLLPKLMGGELPVKVGEE